MVSSSCTRTPPLIRGENGKPRRAGGECQKTGRGKNICFFGKNKDTQPRSCGTMCQGEQVRESPRKSLKIKASARHVCASFPANYPRNSYEQQLTHRANKGEKPHPEARHIVPKFVDNSPELCRHTSPELCRHTRGKAEAQTIYK